MRAGLKYEEGRAHQFGFFSFLENFNYQRERGEGEMVRYHKRDPSCHGNIALVKIKGEYHLVSTSLLTVYTKDCL